MKTKAKTKKQTWIRLCYDGTEHDFTIPKFKLDLHKGLPSELRAELYGKVKPPNGTVRLNLIHAGTPKKGFIVTDTLFTHFGCEDRSGVRPYLYRSGFNSPYQKIDPNSRTFVWTTRKNGFNLAIGVMFLSHHLLKKKPVYVLEAVWIHHGYRRKGTLKRYWPYVRAVYGELILRQPISQPMWDFMSNVQPKFQVLPPSW